MSGTVSVSVTATDDQKVAKIALTVDGQQVAVCTARQVKDALVALFQKRDARRSRPAAQPDSPKKLN